MICNEVQAVLAEYLSETIPDKERKVVVEHLSACAACRRECAALQGIRELLKTCTAPPVQVNIPALYHETARSEKQRARRWRRVAVCAGLAATVLLVLAVLPRLELRFEKHQLVLRWATPPPVRDNMPPPPVVRHLDTADEDRLQRMEQLAQALALEVQGLTLKQHEEQTLVRSQFTQLRDELLRLRVLTEQDVTTLTRQVEEILKVKGTMQ